MDSVIKGEELATSQRAKVVEIAKTWIGTPYHHMGRVREAGADCAMLLAEVYEDAGVIEHVPTTYYPPDWHCHQSPQLLTSIVMRYGRRVQDREPLPGDCVLFFFGKDYSHAAIVIDWPIVVHASMASRIVELIDARRDPHLGKCEKRFFTLW